MIESFFRTTLALVVRAIGAPEPKLVITADVPNARSMDGTIFINPQFAQRQFTFYCSEEACNRSIASAIVAHELGHLMLDDDATHPRDRELWSDWIAGRVIAMQALDPAPFVQMIKTFPASKTHPPPSRRIAAFMAGVEGLPMPQEDAS